MKNKLTALLLALLPLMLSGQVLDVTTNGVAITGPNSPNTQVTIQSTYVSGTNAQTFLRVQGNVQEGNGAAYLTLSNGYAGNTSAFTILEAHGALYWLHDNDPTYPYTLRGMANGTPLEFFGNSSSGGIVGSITTTSATTSYNTTSDRRLKTHIRDLPGSGAIVDALRPRLFDWKNGGKDNYGFVAQELYAVFPQAVTKGDDDPEKVTRQWSMDAAKLVPVLTAEIKDLRARVAALEAATAKQTDAMAHLAQQFAALRTQLAENQPRPTAAHLASASNSATR